MIIKKNNIFSILIISLIIVLTLFITITKSFLKELPSIDSLEDYTPDLITKIYDINNDIISEFFIERRTLIPLSEIPVDMQNAVIAAEDTRFFKHWGIDIYGIFRSFFKNLVSGRKLQGGSTITMQLSRGLFLSRMKVYTRKIKEILLSIKIERNYSKEEILQLYLNQIFLGHDIYGVESAANSYFNKSMKDLNLSECALIAGLIPSPNRYSPFHDLARAYNRRTYVLKRMRIEGFITESEERKANSVPIYVKKREEDIKQAPYFVEWIRRQLEEKYGSNAIYKGGLEVYTTLDISMQKTAERMLEVHLSNFDIKRKEEVPEELKKNEVEISEDELEKLLNREVQGGIVAIDPKTGQVRVMVGGRDFKESKFNRMLQAKRQPGSGFKPFIYTAAIDNGYTPSFILDDSPVSYYHELHKWVLLSNTTDLSDLDERIVENLDLDRVWQPQNYSKKYLGPTTLRNALITSRNVCSIKLLDLIRPITAADYAERMGISTRIEKTLSMALGSSEVLPIELASAYCVLANRGIRTKPYSIIRVKDMAGNVLEDNFPEEKVVLSPQTAYIMTHLLSEVCEYGTGRYTRLLRRPRAGKTGTTNDYTDAWFTGFVPNLACCVWAGYDDNMTLGEKKTGGGVAAPIWTDFMKTVLADTPVLDFSVPPNITFVMIDTKTGLLALEDSEDSVLEAYLKGTEPKKYSMPNNTEGE